MFGEIAATATFVAAGAKFLDIATGESKKRQQEMTDKSVEKYFDKKDQKN